MSDEGMFRPPGAPGGDLQPWRHAGPPPPAPTPSAGQHHHRDEDQEHDDGGPARPPYPTGPRRWRPDLLPDTAWRLIGAGAAVALYLASAGLPWWRTSAADCARLYPAAADLRDTCEHVTASGSRVAVWLALVAGVVLLARLTRLGPALLDAAPVAAAGLADVFAARTVVVTPPGLHLTWPGPAVVLPLLAVLTVAAVQVYRAAGVSLQEMTAQARAGRAGRVVPRVPGWLRLVGRWRRRDDRRYHSSWRRRRRRRRRWLFAGAAVAGAVVVFHSCAGLDTNPLPATPAAEPGAQGAGGGAGGPGQAGASPGPAEPDGAQILTSARRAVAAAHTVHIDVDQVAGAGITVDLQLTADRRATGSITTPSLAIYDVRRIGARCWVRGLPGHGVAAWVPTCTIPAVAGTPALDVAALTDWRVMVAPLPGPAGATTSGPERLGVFGGRAWHVTTPDGAAVYIDASGTDPHPVRVAISRGRLGALQVNYDRWNDGATTITPP